MGPFSVRYYRKSSDKDFISNEVKKDDVRKYLAINGSETIESLITEDAWHLNLVVTNNCDEPIGFVTCRLVGRSGMVYIGRILVSKHYRGNGVGTILLKHLEKLTEECWNVSGYYGLTIENKSMEKFFEKAGYKNSGTYKAFTYRAGKMCDQTLFNRFI
ncbi:MAG: GNAT family N-acetyltransferase [Candidatus Peribacteraceae bacterium]|nr:GNAT family N-acetyltransferase [Candidatus Peribacteraceae bacterium]